MKTRLIISIVILLVDLVFITINILFPNQDINIVKLQLLAVAGMGISAGTSLALINKLVSKPTEVETRKHKNDEI